MVVVVAKWQMVNIYDNVSAPEKSGCYAIMVRDFRKKITRCAYIGSAKNLKKRTTGHPVMSVLDGILRHPLCVILMVREKTKGFRELEKRLIRRINPPCNRQHCSGRKWGIRGMV